MFLILTCLCFHIGDGKRAKLLRIWNMLTLLLIFVYLFIYLLVDTAILKHRVSWEFIKLMQISVLWNNRNSTNIIVLNVQCKLQNHFGISYLTNCLWVFKLERERAHTHKHTPYMSIVEECSRYIHQKYL
jgi:hypothetical protein